MNRISRHKILLAGDSYDHCNQQVRKFFDLTSLVIYDCIEDIRDESVSAVDPGFFDRVAEAEARNRKSVAELIEELVKAKVVGIEDLGRLEQGYLSKTLHILTHFLDGFIGIDSYFYNLLDDSHWLPSGTAEAIRQQPERYWLLHIDCYAATAAEAGLLHF